MVLNGAEDETRTRDIHLGKVALYQLSHFRILSICTARRAAPVVVGAEDETRTRDIHLGKVALYQLSHFRIPVIYQSGHPSEIRTRDPLIKSQVLYRLS